MATATMERTGKAATIDERSAQSSDDGYPTREWVVDGEPRTFSLRPFADAERPLYWNPLYPGQQMWWREHTATAADGITRVVVKHRWNQPFPGSFSPRDAWEEHMTREWMVRSLEGCQDPDQWKGWDHPEGFPHMFRCECSWGCGKLKVMEAHQRKLRHRFSMTD